MHYKNTTQDIIAAAEDIAAEVVNNFSDVTPSRAVHMVAAIAETICDNQGEFFITVGYTTGVDVACADGILHQPYNV